MASLWFFPLLLLLLVEGSHGRPFYPLPNKLGYKDKQTLQMLRPFNIAHRGSNGELPEETSAAYMRAIEEGADFIETDILGSKDGSLICFHDVTLDDTTDIADHKEFADRSKPMKSKELILLGVDFRLKELKTLRAKQRYYIFRDQQYNGKFSIIRELQAPVVHLRKPLKRCAIAAPHQSYVRTCSTFEEFIEIALDADRIVGIYPEIKNPIFINQHVKWANGKKFEDKFVATLLKYGYRGAYKSKEWLKQPVFIQSFAPTSLIYISNLTDSPKIFLIDDVTIPTQDTNQSYWEITSDGYLEFIKDYVVGIGPWKDTIVPVDKNYLTTPSDLVAKAHAHDLQVHPYTYRNENEFLHFNFHQDPYAEYDYWINKIGVDGLFTDFTGSLHWYQELATVSASNQRNAFSLLHKISHMISSYKGV